MNFEEYYEQEIGEPWSDLERRVLARHPLFAAMAQPPRKRFPRLRRAWCFIAHWRRQLRDPDTRYHAWQCGICGERWIVRRGNDDN